LASFDKLLLSADIINDERTATSSGYAFNRAIVRSAIQRTTAASGSSTGLFALIFHLQNTMKKFCILNVSGSGWEMSLTTILCKESLLENIAIFCFIIFNNYPCKFIYFRTTQ